MNWFSLQAYFVLQIVSNGKCRYYKSFYEAGWSSTVIEPNLHLLRNQYSWNEEQYVYIYQSIDKRKVNTPYLFKYTSL